MPTEWGPSKEVLDKYVPIEYIIEWFDDKIPREVGGLPRQKAQSMADKVLVLKSTTGTGKSTVLPQDLFHNFFKRTGKSILVSQPRIATAISIPMDIASYNTPEKLEGTGKTPLEMGVTIGYKTGMFRNAPRKGLIFCTIGVLQQQLMSMSDKDFMANYFMIILDEAHIKETPTLGTIYSVKKFMQRNWQDPECPFLIVTSATFDTVAYADYLLSEVPAPDRYKHITIVEGLSYPVEEKFLTYDSTDMMATAKKLLVDIHAEYSSDLATDVDPPLIAEAREFRDNIKDGGDEDLLIFGQHEPSDILVFVSGREGMFLEGIVNQLNTKVKLFNEFPMKPLAVNSKQVAAKSQSYKEAIEMLTSDLKVMIGTSSRHVSRKVVIGTPAIETGLTLENLKYVIDLGWVQMTVFIPNFNMNCMIVRPVTVDMAKQRKGRVGRQTPGIFYAAYSRDTFDRMQVQQYAEIIRAESSYYILTFILREFDPDNNLSKYSIKEIVDKNILSEFEGKSVDLNRMDLIDLPPPDMLQYTLEKLFTLGAINSNSEPTLTGLIMARMKATMLETSKVILAGFFYGANVMWLITLSAIIESDVVFDINDESVLLPAILLGDPGKLKHYISDDYVYSLLVMLFIIASDKPVRDLCDEYEIDYKDVLVVLEKREEIILNCANIGLDPFWGQSRLSSYRSSMEFASHMKKCIYEGFKMNMAVWSDDHYRDRRTGWKLRVDSKYVMQSESLKLYNVTNPKYVILYKLGLKQRKKDITYQQEMSKICVLDGYVDIDVNYDY